jgi:hypothetical protein
MLLPPWAPAAPRGEEPEGREDEQRGGRVGAASADRAGQERSLDRCVLRRRGGRGAHAADVGLANPVRARPGIERVARLAAASAEDLGAAGIADAADHEHGFVDEEGRRAMKALDPTPTAAPHYDVIGAQLGARFHAWLALSFLQNVRVDATRDKTVGPFSGKAYGSNVIGGPAF